MSTTGGVEVAGHRTTLVFRWLAYAAMLAVVVMGLAGLLERELSAGARAGDDSARATWPSVTRQGLKPSLRIEVANPGPASRAPVLRISAAYLRDLQFASVTPEPESMEAVGDGQVEMRCAELAPGERLEAQLSFDITAQASRLRARSPLIVELGGRPLVAERIETLILP